jgi:hypothetical protein
LEIIVGAAEASNEVILEGADDTFCVIVVMEMRWSKL